MIFYSHAPNFTPPAWLDADETTSTISFRFELPTGAMIRIEGRNATTDSPTILGYAYDSGTLIVPFYKQYRAVRFGSVTGGAVWTEPQVNRATPAGNSIRLAPGMQMRRRLTPKGVRKGGYRLTQAFACDFYNVASPATRVADGCSVSVGTASRDYTNCRSGVIQSGETAPYSIKVNVADGTSSQLWYDLRVSSGGSGGVDITGGTGKWPVIKIVVWVDPAIHGQLSGNLRDVQLTINDDAGNSNNITLGSFQQFSAGCTGSGWNVLVGRPPASWPVDPTDVSLFRLFIRSKAGTTCAVTVDSIQFLIPTPSQKVVVFRDDDGYIDCIKTAQEYDKYGIRGNFHIHPQLTGTSGYLSKADLIAMQRSGHVIGNHGWSKYYGDVMTGTDYLNVRYLTTEEFVNTIIRPAVWWLQDNGFEQGARIYATHQGNITPDQAALALETELDSISNTSTPGEQADFVNSPDMMETNFATGIATAGAATLLANLDDHGGVAVTYGHANTSGNSATMASYMNAVVPKLKDGTYKCKTFPEIINGA